MHPVCLKHRPVAKCPMRVRLFASGPFPKRPDANSPAKKTGCIRTGLDASGLISHTVGSIYIVYLPDACLHACFLAFLPSSRLPARVPAACLLACMPCFLPAFLPALLPACMLASLHACLFDGCLPDVRDSFGIRSRFVRDACLPACLPAGRTVLYCTTCRYGSPHCRTGCVRDSFGIRSGFVRESFGMPAILPASLHACRYGSPHCRTGCVRDTFGIRLGFVRDSFGMPAFLPASSLQVVRYCTALHVDTGALIVGRGAFVIRSGFVWDSFEIRSGCLPSCLPPCMHAGGGRQ